MNHRSSRTPLAIMVALMLAATFLRFAAMFDAPPGMRYDEMTVVVEADRIRAGDRPIYMDSSAREALYFYLVAIGEDTLAQHLFTQRWLSAAFGLIAVAAIFALGRRMFNVRVGLLAAALMATAFWALMYSRIGDRIVMVPAFAAIAMIFFWRGLDRARRLDFVIAGILMGISAYTYTATRTLPAVLIGFLIYLFVFNRGRLRKHGLNIGLTLAVGLAIALPMAIHIATIPGADRRVGEVAGEGALNSLQHGNLIPVINSAVITGGMFIATGDPESLYNVPGRPVFDILTGVIFYLAVLICCRKLRHSRYAFLLIWLMVGLVPPLLAWPAASNSHSILAQVPVFLIAAIGLDGIADRFSRTPSSRVLSGLFVGLVLIIHTVTSINDYFNRWATNPTVRTEQQAGIAATARYFVQHPAPTPLVFSSGDVVEGKPWSSTVFRMLAPTGYTNARWFDARSSFVFPQGATDLTLINATLDDAPAPLDNRLIEDLFPVVEPSPLAANVFSATHVVSTLNTRLMTLTQASVSWPAGVAATQAATLPIAFGDRINLIGYEYRKTSVAPGKNIRLTTYWRAQNLGLEPLAIFVHVLDAQGNIVAQWDGLTIDQHYIQPGDILAQVHSIGLRPDFPEGTYRLQLGLYSTQTLQRVPIEIGGQPVADRILLQPIEVKP